MEPKEKAKELVEKFRNQIGWIEKDYPVDLYRESLECARICVEEIVASYTQFGLTENDTEIKYWNEVLNHLK